ncbi:major capsid protein [Sphingobium sp. YG1]|uniref:major capsid protein n=1 Tax=Sphingobium sp. YG1 TaxID=2082188 RepID=UPI000DBBA4E2|nr:major capsid protein [Sphingobium sp. YG1]BBD01844.1 hypothetical protein YGS_C1P3099 [Sphingobium sp. YG1]
MEDDLLYGTDELMDIIEPLFIPGNFLLKLAFPGIMEFTTEQVSFDRVIDDMRLAPWVSPLAPGKIMQPRGFQRESLIPGYLKPKNAITGKEVLKRMPGEPLGGDRSPEERRALIMVKYMTDHRTYIERRLEWMASSILRTGAVVIVGDDYPSTRVDYARDADLTKTLLTTDRWGETGVSPYDDVDAWIGEVADTSGAAVNVVVMDAQAWNFYQADPKTQKALDRTLGQTASINLGLTPALPGSPVYKGNIGNVEFYVYNDTYEGDDGVKATLLPAFTVILISQGGVEGSQLFGSILDPRNNYEAARYFAKNWIDEDPAGEFVMTQSAPILAPKRINATACVTVR